MSTKSDNVIQFLHFGYRLLYTLLTVNKPIPWRSSMTPLILLAILGFLVGGPVGLIAFPLVFLAISFIANVLILISLAKGK